RLGGIRFQRRSVVVRMPGAHRGRRMGNLDPVAVRMSALLPQLVGLLLPQADLVFDRAGGAGLGSVRHGDALFTAARARLSTARTRAEAQPPGRSRPSGRAEERLDRGPGRPPACWWRARA